MDARSQEILNKIVVKPVSELLSHEVVFLKARRSYLSPNETQKFESILVVKKQQPKQSE